MDEFDDELNSQVDSDEVTLYQTCQLGEHEGILQWWKDNQLQYPGLAKLARSALCVQASSAPSERVAGTVVSKR